MADRILTWSVKRCDGNPTTILPAYYMESEYTPTAVRIYAETAPTVDDAEFEILDDGVSIMNDHQYSYSTYAANTAVYTGVYTIHLPINSTVDEMAEDFREEVIAAGSWVTCQIRQDGGGKNFTIQMELDKVSESDEDTD